MGEELLEVRVVISGSCSTWMLVTNAVLQGFILKSFLFNILLLEHNLEELWWHSDEVCE